MSNKDWDKDLYKKAIKSGLPSNYLKILKQVAFGRPIGVGPWLAPLDEALQIARAPQKLYHYTSLSGFLGIIASKSMWASNIFYLNDATEFLYTVDLSTNVLIQKAKENPRNNFVGASGKTGFTFLE